jgi:hypothetical protein
LPPNRSKIEKPKRHKRTSNYGVKEVAVPTSARGKNLVIRIGYYFTRIDDKLNEICTNTKNKN